jgi:glutamate--cysteine ligase
MKRRDGAGSGGSTEELPWHSTDVVASRDAAEHYVGLVCFKIGPPRLVGIELEWLVHDAHDPTAPIPAGRLAAALGEWGPGYLHRPRDAPPPTRNGVRHKVAAQQHSTPLPRGSAVTVEPGGQVEISSLPAASLTDCLADVAADSRALRSALTRAGLTASGYGIDPFRPPSRILDLPRYVAMESYFDRFGRAGRTMMCSTAAVQVSLDAGTDHGDSGPDSLASRWRALHALGPVLVAMFANSPVHAGARTAWRSARQAAWLGTDPARTTAPPPDGRADADPREAYARYALDAPLLCVRRGDRGWAAPPGVTFADWIAGALAERPTFGDLEYHLSTLFPPIRAQGHLEVRYVDAQRGEGWVVPAAVLWALTRHPVALDLALSAAEPVVGQWRLAAQYGLGDRSLARAAEAVLAAAQACLVGSAPPSVRDAVDRFAARYTMRGRSPADDWLPRQGHPEPVEADVTGAVSVAGTARRMQ